MLQRIAKMFGGSSKSKDLAKNRLKLILVQDRLGVDEETMRELQREITKLLLKYFTLEPNEVEVELQRDEQEMALVANIPIAGMKRHEQSRSKSKSKPKSRSRASR